MIKIGTMIGDRYEVLERIGMGGMSDVEAGIFRKYEFRI